MDYNRTEEKNKGGTHMKRCIVATFLSIVLVLSVMLIPASAAGRFTDVKSGDWYETFVTNVAEKGLMNGTSANTFSPKKTLTRAELVQTLYAMAGKPRVIRETSFEDLKQDWYKDAVSWATSAGVTQGLDWKTFGPSNSVTREQAATFLRAYNENVEVHNTISDRSLDSYRDKALVADWSAPSLRWAVDKGLVKSTSTTSLLLEPRRSITRAELAVMLTNYEKLTYPEPKEAGENLYPEILQDLAGRSFVFASGAGAWGNVLSVKDNGEFEGYYRDTDAMGGEGYDATRAFCNYTGTFYVKKKVSDTAYVLGIRDLKMKNTPGESFIQDRILMTATAPYGLDNVDDLYLYLPGKTTADLPEDYKTWDRSAAETSSLPNYGLYNINAGYGWYESSEN